MDLLPLHHLLITNEPPGSDEHDQVSAAYKSVNVQLQSIDAQMARLQAELTQISGDRDRTQKRADQYRGVLSPLRRLPPEILSKIFLHCCPPFSVPSSVRPPLAFGSVCRTWRIVSTQTPILWNSLHLSLPEQTTMNSMDVEIEIEKFRTMQAGWEKWIERAGQVLPLDLSVEFPVTVVGMPQTKLVEFCRKFLSYSARLRHAEIVIPLGPDSPYSNLFSTLDGLAMPNFEFFKIYPSPNSTIVVGAPLPPNFAFLQTAPRLHGLSVNFTLPPRSLAKSTFAHAGLSILEISEPMAVPLQTVLDVLEGCPNLQTLRLLNTLTNIEEEGPGEYEQVTLSKLTRLVLHLPADRSQLCIISLLETLHLPSLLDLAIRGVPAQATVVDRPLSPALLTMLEKSECALQALEIFHCRNEPAGIFLDCLLATSQSLRELHVRDAMAQLGMSDDPMSLFSDEVLSAFTGDALCPHLHRVTFVIPPNTSPSLVLAFLQSRAAGGLLEEAHVYVQSIDQDTADQIVSLHPGYRLFISDPEHPTVVSFKGSSQHGSWATGATL